MDWRDEAAHTVHSLLLSCLFADRLMDALYKTLSHWEEHIGIDFGTACLSFHELASIIRMRRKLQDFEPGACDGLYGVSAV